MLPSNCLYVWIPCVSHLCQLVNDTGNFKLLAGDVYAYEYVARFPSHQQALVHNVRRFFDEYLDIFDDGREPLAEDRDHLDKILEYTIKRHANHIRGRLQSCDSPEDALLDGKGVQAAEEVCARVRAVFNGDVRSPRPQHVLTPETKGMARADIVDLCTDVAIEAKLVPGLASEMPSANKWGSTMKSLERQVAGIMIHGVGPSSGQMTFRTRSEALAEDAAENDEDLRLVLKRKSWRVRVYTGSPDRLRAASVSLFVVVPVDHLWRHVQFAELAGGLIRDLSWPKTNVFRVALSSYVKMLIVAISDGALSPLVRHWSPDETSCAYNEFVSELRLGICNRSAHLWFRCYVPFTDLYPYLFVGMYDVRLPDAVKRRIAAELFTICKECLDPDFSRKV